MNEGEDGEETKIKTCSNRSLLLGNDSIRKSLLSNRPQQRTHTAKQEQIDISFVSVSPFLMNAECINFANNEKLNICVT